MPAVSEILVTIPAKPHHKELLEKTAPDANFTYLAPNQVTDDILAKMDVVLGNLPPEAFKAAKNLKLLQLNSAGSDVYAAPGVLPEGVILANATGSYGLAISEYLIATLFSVSKKLMKNGWSLYAPIVKGAIPENMISLSARLRMIGYTE